MKKLVFLSCDSLGGYVLDDHLLLDELKNDFEVTTVSWNRPQDWSKFDAVIIRTTWDYMRWPIEFQNTLKEIQLSGAKLFNSFSVVAWNIHKFYLKELQSQGTVIVPTVFFSHDELPVVPLDWSCSRFILKPAISAGAYKTTVISHDDLKALKLDAGDWLLQPFLESIFEGEISLIYFDKKFSHALIKVPKQGEFRVQEEFGGSVMPYSPDEKLLKLASDILSHVDMPLLYARVDLVPFKETHALMELELIEPALYFRTNLKAAQNFHSALKNYF